MASAVAELESGLQAMLALKPPGVTGSRIQSITTLCKANVQSESVLIQKLFTHFKKAPGTHKLGVLYVVDSVTREWVVQAKAAGQTINSAAPDGTYAAGVHRVKELLPVLMNDITQSAPEDQKEKIKKLVDIWEKGQTFPLQMLTAFKDKLSASMQNRSTTPDGSPPPDLQARLGLQQAKVATPVPAAPPHNTASILAALANMARQNTTAPPAVSNAPVSYNPLTSLASLTAASAPSNPAPQIPAALNHQSLPFAQFPPPVNVAAAAPSFLAPAQNDVSHHQAVSSQTTPWMPPASSVVPPPPPPPPAGPAGGGIDPQTAMLVKILVERGMTAEQIAGIIGKNNGGGALPPQFPAQSSNPNGFSNGQHGRDGRPAESRDSTSYHDRDSRRSPPSRRRSRSPSPARGWNPHNSPSSRHRNEASFDYSRGRDSPARSRGDDRGRGNDYRQRSPPHRGRSPSPPRNRDNYAGERKWIDHDSTLPRGSIKVLSRTLFVGGVNSNEQDLRNIFSRYGTVQTCIVNKEKRHAFVKMISREDAVNAKDSMEETRHTDHGRARSFNQTRWGVGFGPRDCSDYATGISIIPISKLTDADRKWITTAEYGGTGGKPIESGMVVEEPDIEIGQGVSSKAISRRMQNDKERGGNNGTKNRDRDDDDSRVRRSGDRDDHGRDDNRRNDSWKEKTSAAPQVIPPFSFPGFPGGIPGFPMSTLPNGMPAWSMPPGFAFPGMPPAPGQAGYPTQQPPPPGRD